MRAATVALVLIVGAIVVLWYGNTLNSWVLGGLIGGFAALLISIPISLTLFLHLSRQHDEQLKAQAQEAQSLEQAHPYPEAPVEVYETDAYMLPAGREEVEEQYAGRTTTARNLPVPSQPRLPVPRQNQVPSTSSLVVRQRSTNLVSSQQPRDNPALQGNGRGAPARRPSAQRQYYPGFHGYQPNAHRGQQQTAALRAARLEALQQHDDMEVFPTGISRKLPVARPLRNEVEQSAGPRVPGPSRQLPQQTANQYQPRRTVEGSSLPPGARRPLPARGESSARQSSQNIHREHQNRQQEHSNTREMQTDKLGNQHPHPQTGPVRQQPQTGPVRQQPQTGQIARNPQVEAQRRNPDVISGSLKNPLVRRAPYMYEDDPLRQELAQQIEAPIIRRSSRYENYEDEED